MLLASLKHIHFLRFLYWNGGKSFGIFHFCVSSTLFAKSATLSNSDRSENLIPFQNFTNSHLSISISAFCHELLVKTINPLLSDKEKSLNLGFVSIVLSS
jgi:hypothetical protein